jgi:hypothetical protein
MTFVLKTINSPGIPDTANLELLPPNDAVEMRLKVYCLQSG